MLPISIKTVSKSRLPEVDFNNLPFGHTFSDHMFVADYIDGQWQNPRVEPYGDMMMSPANMALHYGQSIFEGMKAHWHVDGYPVAFRPHVHFRRFNTSAKRLNMPEVPEEMFFGALDSLFKLDGGWVPRDGESALYIRPFMFANDHFLGVKSSDSYRFMMLTGPVGVYFNRPVRLWVETEYVRAALHGGVGYAKAAGNYAASIMPAAKAKEKGFDQVLWLDANEFKYLQECGTMNIFVVIGDKIITPPTSDSILAGVTRASLIALWTEMGVDIEEREVSIHELVEAYHAGQLKEVFGVGTAAVISHVAEIGYEELLITLPPVEDRKYSPYMKQYFEELKIGKHPDTHGWLYAPKTETVTA